MEPSIYRRLCTALCLALAPLAANAAETCSLSGLELPITMIGSRAVAKIGINGKQVPMTVDSGAFFSSLTPSAAEQLHLERRELPFGYRIKGLVGEVDNAYRVTVDKVVLADGELPNVEFIVGGNEIGAGTMGLLGRNFLSMADIEYDLAHGMIRLIFPQGDCKPEQMAYWAGKQPVVELKLLRDLHDQKRPALRAEAKVNDYEIRVLFDTGAQSQLTLGAARKAGITKEQMTPAGKMYGIGEGRADAWTAPLQRFAIGGEEVRDVRMRVGDFSDGDFDMLLGVDFFLAHRIYVSKSLKRMFFTHNGGPVFALSATATNAARPLPADADDATLDAAGYQRRAAASAARKDYAGALADFDRACPMAPQDAACLAQRGQVHLALRQGREALKDFDAALQLDPKQTDALLLRAGMRPAGEREAALSDLKALDGALPAQATERFQIARLYARFDQPAEAVQQLNQWIASRETDINLPSALNWRCAMRARVGTELEGALADCNRAIKADDKNPSYFESRGIVELRRGEAEPALADFSRALELKPELATAIYGRGIARARLGQTDAARTDLEAARKLRPKIDTEAQKIGLPAPG
jgi:predicted aspartyl protease/Flp pilus assembly protein TadD